MNQLNRSSEPRAECKPDVVDYDLAAGTGAGAVGAYTVKKAPAAGRKPETYSQAHRHKIRCAVRLC
jgi:hypothetical protein